MCDPVFQAKRFAGIHIDAETDMLSITFITGFATVFGTAEGIRAAQAKSRREEHRSRKNNLIVHVPKSSQFSPILEGRSVVLSGDRLFIDTGTAHDQPFGHPFEGYYLPYPDTRYSGLVSSITHEAPIMNWIYVDRQTYQIKFGNRMASEGHFTGPWDCTRQDRRLVFGGWEGFCAVYENGLWGLYFDVDGDHLKSKLGDDTHVILDIDLVRRELRTARPQAAAEAEAAAAAAAAKEAAANSPSEKPTTGESREPSQPRYGSTTDAARGGGERSQPAKRNSDECQLEEVIDQYAVNRDDDDTRSDSQLSGITFTGEERLTDSDSRRTDDDGIRVYPSPPPEEEEASRALTVYSGSRDSDPGWTSSVYSEDSRPRYSYQPSEEEVDELREDVD
ncbi:hypothetical protein NLU13_1421 [Sarocladium strictum]|uniref:Uncharacterized protein n=1 Tax=Sarocladium strictum TaxID=5046 RepID=A0AA39LC79_SARSR|nr:hypothetical protein NLU13_1421 [Sarocladium strictum]